MKIDAKVTQKQLEFINANVDEVLYGGAAGGGKSYGQVLDGYIYALQYSGSKQLILRRTFGELQKTLILTSFMLYSKKLAKYNGSEHVWIFKNGSRVQFGYLAKDKDVEQYQSAEFDALRFDELTQFSEFRYLYMLSRVRGVNSFPKLVKSTANPGGIGHGWVKGRFVDAAPAGKPFELDGRTRLYIPAKVFDNPFLMKSDPGYIKRLEALPEAQRKALLNGDWNVFEGQFFTMWDPEAHIVKPFPIPAHWKKYRMLDYGRDMTACLWMAVNELGDAFVYRGFGSGSHGQFFNQNGKVICDERPLFADMAAKEILSRTPKTEKIECTYAPPDLWQVTGSNAQSIAELFALGGMPLLKSKSARVHGWAVVSQWLNPTPDAHEKPIPRLRIFDCCRELIISLPQLRYDDKNSLDVATEPHEITHFPDALRYGLVNRPLSAEKPGIDGEYTYNEADEIESFLNFGR